MKKYVLLLALASVAFCMPVNNVSAQCEGRYIDPIFETVTVTENIQYGFNIGLGGFEKSLEFDFYEPAGDEFAERPLIILAHGGTFVAGDENSADIVTLCTEYAKRGYACASINYRLLPLDIATGALFGGDITTLFFEEVVMAVADMRAAIRFFRKDAEEQNLYRIDSDQVFIGGMSAGAILAIHVAYLENEDDLAAYTEVPTALNIINANGGFEGDSGNEGYSSTVNGVIDLAGAVGSLDFIEEGEAPIVSVHGNADDTVPYEYGYANAFGFNVIEMFGSKLVYDHAQDLGIESALMTIEGGDHVSPINSTNMTETINFTLDFLYTQVQCTESVGLEENLMAVTQTNRLQVYPNPANAVFSVNMEQLPANQQATLQVFNAVGMLVKSETVNTNDVVRVNTNRLTAGMYQIQVITNGYVSTKAVIVR